MELADGGAVFSQPSRMLLGCPIRQYWNVLYLLDRDRLAYGGVLSCVFDDCFVRVQ